MTTALETVIEVGILAFLAWPVVRLFLAPALNGRLGGAPELAIAIGVGLAMYVAAIAAVSGFRWRPSGKFRVALAPR